jgi:hypothetical protein
MSYTIAVLNEITAKLGGTTVHRYDINALNEWCTLESGTGGHRYDIDAYNELDVIYGGSGGHKYVINALNSMDVALGGSGGFVYEYDALVQVGSLLNQPPVIPDGTPTSAYDVTDVGFKVVSSVDTSLETVVTLEYGLVSETYTNTVTAAESPVNSVGDVNFTLAGLTPFTDYYFRVKAVSAAGTSYSQEFVQKTNSVAEVVTYTTGLTTPLSAGQIAKLNTLVLSLRSGLGISLLSDAFDVLYLFAGETSESSLRNLVKNANHATEKFNKVEYLLYLVQDQLIFDVRVHSN